MQFDFMIMLGETIATLKILLFLSVYFCYSDLKDESKILKAIK